MKKIIFLITAICLTAYGSSAQTNDTVDGNEHSSARESAAEHGGHHGAISSKHTQVRNDEEVAASVASYLCRSFEMHDSEMIVHFSKKGVDEILEAHLGYVPSKLEVIQFFNTYNEFMTCYDSAGYERHFLQFGTGFTQLRYVMLGLMKNYRVQVSDASGERVISYDFNAVTCDPEFGTCETIIDFIERNYVHDPKYQDDSELITRPKQIVSYCISSGPLRQFRFFC